MSCVTSCAPTEHGARGLLVRHRGTVVEIRCAVADTKALEPWVCRYVRRDADVKHGNACTDGPTERVDGGAFSAELPHHDRGDLLRPGRDPLCEYPVVAPHTTAAGRSGIGGGQDP